MSQQGGLNSSGGGGGSGFTSINVQTIATSGIYTPTAGMQFVFIQMVGGGGGGGGADTSTFSVGAGGGGGEYAEGLFDAASIGASQIVVIGTAGVGNSAAAGSDGTATSVGALINANGGSGGGVLSSNTNVYLTRPGAAGGIHGSGGSTRFPGPNGGFASIVTPSGGIQYVLSGQGYAGRYTPGASPPLVQDGTVVAGLNGISASGFGGGGSGAINYVNGSAQTGGNGSPGYIVITEYIG